MSHEFPHHYLFFQSNYYKKIYEIQEVKEVRKVKIPPFSER